LEGLATISSVHPDSISTVTLPLLFHNLPDSAPPIENNSARGKYRGVLGALTKLCISSALYESLVIRITSKLDFLSATRIDTELVVDSTQECTVAYAFDLLSTLLDVITKKLDLKHSDTIKYFDQIVPRLYQLAIVAATPKIGDEEPLFRDRRLLRLVGRITETLLWALTPE
jgi:DNA repair/transcription protein MET18/MMS19